MTRMPNFSAGLLKSMKHIESDLRTWNIIGWYETLYMHTDYSWTCVYSAHRIQRNFRLALPVQQSTPSPYLPRSHAIHAVIGCFSSWKPYQELAYKTPPCSWPLHTFFFSNRHSRYILLSPVYIHSSLAIYTRLAYLACMCGVMSVPCAVFADMRFFFSLRYSSFVREVA